MKNKRGSALLIVIMAFAVLMILGTAVLTVSLSETKQVVHQERKAQAYYAARSGAEALASYLIENPSQAQNIIDKTSSGPAQGILDSNTYFMVTVTGTADSPLIMAEGYRTISGASTEVGRVMLAMKNLSTNLFDYSVFANSILDIGNNATILGNVGTNNSVYSPSSYPGVITNAGITFPEIDEVPFDANTMIWNTDSGNAINNSGINYYHITNGSWNNNGDYYYSGTGEIHILIDEPFNFNSSGGIVPSLGTTAKLYLYYNGTEDLEYNGHADSTVAIFAPKAKVSFNGGGSKTYKAAIICNEYIGPNSNCTLDAQTSFDMSNMAIIDVSGFERGTYGE